MVRVIPENPIVSYGQNYKITLRLSNRRKFSEIKRIKDFRTLSTAMHRIAGCTDDIEVYDETGANVGTLPLWADNVKLDLEVSGLRVRERASILATWLTKRLEENPKLHFLVSYWLDNRQPFDAHQFIQTDAKSVLRALRKEEPSLKFQAPKLVIFEHKYESTDKLELSALRLEVVASTEESRYDGWWSGETVNGKRGIFPSNFTAELTQTETEKIIFPEGTPSQPPIKAESVPKDPKFIVPGPYEQREPRQRLRIDRYNLCCREAFSQLLRDGLTIEGDDGKLAEFIRDELENPMKGDIVTLFYSAFLWYPQSQSLLEFGSSDRLVSDNEDGPLVFCIGEDQAIDGIEEAVSKMNVGQSVRVVIHPRKAYDSEGCAPNVPGNSYLVYHLTLTDIEKKGKFKNNGRKFLNVVSIRRGGPSMKKMVESFDPESDLRHKLSLAEVQKIVATKSFKRFNVNERETELYLTKEDFEKAFKIDFTNWNLLPMKEKVIMKKKIGLI